MDDNKSYGRFAGYYDVLTDDVHYEKRVEYLEKLMGEHLECRAELIADLGCGTGTVCNMLSEKGYDMIGIDSSEEMLMEAARKSFGKNILYLNQDMCDFELYGTVDVFLSMLDSLNYLTSVEELSEVFALVHNYLNPGGIFIFDVNSEYKFREVLSDNVFVNEAEGVFYTWENCFDGEFCDFRLNFFVKSEDGSYRRFCEEHTQRFHTLSEITSAASSAGLEVVAIYGDMSLDAPKSDEERLFFVLKKQMY